MAFWKTQIKWVAQSCQAHDGWSQCAKGVAAGWRRGVWMWKGERQNRSHGIGMVGEVSADTQHVEHGTYR